MTFVPIPSWRQVCIIIVITLSSQFGCILLNRWAALRLRSGREVLDCVFQLPSVLFWHQALSGCSLWLLRLPPQQFFLPLLKDVQIRLISDSKLPSDVDESVQACLSLDIGPGMISWPLWAWHKINNPTLSCQIVKHFTGGEKKCQFHDFFYIFSIFHFGENILYIWIVLNLQCWSCYLGYAEQPVPVRITSAGERYHI